MNLNERTRSNLPLSDSRRRQLIGATAISVVALIILTLFSFNTPRQQNEVTVRIAERQQEILVPIDETYPSDAAEEAPPSPLPIDKVVELVNRTDNQEISPSTKERSIPKKSVANKKNNSARRQQKTTIEKKVIALKTTKAQTKAKTKVSPKPEKKSPQKKRVSPQENRAFALLRGEEAKRNTVQYVVALASYENPSYADALVNKLAQLGIRTYLQKVKTATGEIIRVRSGPYNRRDDAERVVDIARAANIKPLIQKK